MDSDQVILMTDENEKMTLAEFLYQNTQAKDVYHIDEEDVKGVKNLAVGESWPIWPSVITRIQ